MLGTKLEENAWALKLAKFHFREKSVDHSRRNKGYSWRLEDAIKVPNAVIAVSLHLDV